MTEGMDIGFSVWYKKASDETEKILIPFARVNSHMVPEDGSILCSEPGICMFLLLLFACFFAEQSQYKALWLSVQSSYFRSI